MKDTIMSTPEYQMQLGLLIAQRFNEGDLQKYLWLLKGKEGISFLGKGETTDIMAMNRDTFLNSLDEKSGERLRIAELFELRPDDIFVNWAEIDADGQGNDFSCCYMFEPEELGIRTEADTLH